MFSFGLVFFVCLQCIASCSVFMSNTLKITLRVEFYGGNFIKQGNNFQFPGDFGRVWLKKRLAVTVITIATCLFCYFNMAKHPGLVFAKKETVTKVTQ